MRQACAGTVLRDRLIRRSSVRHSVWRARVSFLCLGVLGTLVAGGSCIAQTQHALRLTVRPHEMATGTQTEKAGQFSLDSLPDDIVYVPEKCVGTQRCPLLIFLHAGAERPTNAIEYERPVADKYGMIILAPSSVSPGIWNWEDAEVPEEPRNRAKIDAAMKQVLRKFAIDPDKIALAGFSSGGPPALLWGSDNLDVFSRVIPMSAGYPPVRPGYPRKNTTTEFLLNAGLEECGGYFGIAQKLRRQGHPTKFVISIRSHAYQPEDYDFVGHWLQESWATPNPAARPTPDTLPPVLLTDEGITKVVAFWKKFMQEPDSTRVTARQAHLREVTVPLKDGKQSVLMTDMPALAAASPAVAADLAAAGLTAEQHDTYRLAMVVALTAWNSKDDIGRPDPVSVVGKNIQFLDKHSKAFDAMLAAGAWSTP